MSSGRAALPAALFAALALALAPAPAPLHAAPAEAEAGFVPLFNGRDLSGWCLQGDVGSYDGLTQSPDGRFSAADGILTVHAHSPRKVERLFTVRQFPRDFVLRLEFRASVNADSGIFLRRPQLQCRDYLVAGPYKSLTRYRPQDWNEIEVVVTLCPPPAGLGWRPTGARWSTEIFGCASCPDRGGRADRDGRTSNPNSL
jgi:hypothetical protein